VRNSYAIFSESITNLFLEKEKKLTEIQDNRTLRLKYNELPLVRFLMYAKSEYLVIAEEAINILSHFSITYLCELGFLALTINVRGFFQLIRECVCACLKFNHVLNFCVRNDKLKFLTNNFFQIFSFYNIIFLCLNNLVLKIFFLCFYIF
jgi:hypothetical protein